MTDSNGRGNGRYRSKGERLSEKRGAKPLDQKTFFHCCPSYAGMRCVAVAIPESIWLLSRKDLEESANNFGQTFHFADDFGLASPVQKNKPMHQDEILICRSSLPEKVGRGNVYRAEWLNLPVDISCIRECFFQINMHRKGHLRFGNKAPVPANGPWDHKSYLWHSIKFGDLLPKEQNTAILEVHILPKIEVRHTWELHLKAISHGFGNTQVVMTTRVWTSNSFESSSSVDAAVADHLQPEG